MKKYLLKKPKLLFIAVLATIIFFMIVKVQAQPTVQDCPGAIPVCEGYYYQPNSFTGTGFYPNEIASGYNCSTNECMNAGEKNDVWYIINVMSDGLLGFLLTPNNSSNDYDWAVYNLTFARCEDIFSRQYEISCNWSANPGPTGPNGGSTYNCVNSGSPNKNALIPVTEGQIIVINISNWSSTNQSGYSLDFATSTALVYDTVRPEISHIYGENVTCGDTTLEFIFTENVLCSSIYASSFELTGPGGPYTITDLYGAVCAVGGTSEKTFTITIDKPFAANGLYHLAINFFTSIQDLCNNIALPYQYPFTVDLGAPVIFDLGMEITNSSCGQSNGSITGIVVTGTQPFTYTWRDDQGNIVGNDLDLLNVPAGLYTLTVDDPNTCQSEAGPYQVDDDGAPEIDDTNIVLTDNTCGLDNGSVTGLEVAGSTNLTFVWTDDIGNVVGDTLDLTNVQGGTYFLKVTDENQCESFAGPYIIEDFPAPILDDVNAIVSGANCQTSNGFIVNIVAAGSTDLTFEWTNEIGTVVGNNLDLTGMPAGFYTLTATDENQCISVTGPYEIEDIAGPQIDETNADISNPVCWDTNGYITGITATGNSGLTYEWTNILGNIVGEEVELVNVGPGTYTLKVTDDALCQSHTEPYELINVGGAFIDEVEISNAYCELQNGYININASGGYGNIKFSINDGNIWYDTCLFENLAPGIYNIWIRDEIDCITPYSGNPVVIENYGEQLAASATTTSPVCQGDNVQLFSDNENVSYLWEGPDGFISTEQNPVIQNITLDGSGTYSLKITSSPYNCVDSTEVEIEVLQSFNINILIDASRNPIFPGDSITFFAIVEDHGVNPVYEWRVNNEVVQSGPDSIYFTSSIYADAVITCSLISQESCADPNPALSNEYYLKVESPVVFFPNSFKPSSTHGNNIFKAVTSLTYIPSYNLTIYNRWGQKIFSTNNVTEGWDGKINGEFAPAGVYVWVVNYSYGKDSNSGGTEIKDNGTVTLLE